MPTERDEQADNQLWQMCSADLQFWPTGIPDAATQLCRSW